MVERVSESIKMPLNLPVLKKSRINFQFLEVDSVKGTLISLNNISFAYSGESELVLKNVDISISMDTKVCFVVQNGSGKTTLIKLLLDQLVPSEGQSRALACWPLHSTFC